MDSREYFYTHFNVLEKIGEGFFGIAFRVTCKSDGTARAVKKQKDPYHSLNDQDLRRKEVVKNFQICSVTEQTYNQHTYPNSKYCVGIYEAWEE